MPASVKRTTSCIAHRWRRSLSCASGTDLRRLPAMELQALQSSGSVGLRSSCRVSASDMSSKM
ncbi:hypothetical protein GQ600_22550 [Phytophthora cactorum]|nr:hypothetical protein GQ600_22550 [Phytophthora cactorum]